MRTVSPFTCEIPSGRFPALLKLLVLSFSAFMGGATVATLGRASLDDTSPYAVLEQLSRVIVLIENQYVEAVERERLLDGAIKGMVAELDPHSSYLPARDFRILRDDARGQFAGIGVEVDFSNDKVTVVAPIEGSPARKAGVRSGDIIVSIDGFSVHGKNAAELIRKMRGAPGSTVRVGIRRKGLADPMHLSIERRVISVSSVLAVSLDGGIGYLRIKQFQSDSHAELLDNITRLRQEMPRLKGILLDMRNNPGGLVHAATRIADEFLDRGTIYSTRHRNRVVSEVEAHRGGALSNLPVVVLVNEFSASASELVAGALQDHRRATVVGARTFGKGSVQSIIDLPHGAGLRLTTMRYYTPLGRTIQVEGIEPDVVVKTHFASNGPQKILRENHLDNHLNSDAVSDRSAAADAQPENDVAARGKPSGKKNQNLAPDELDTHLGVARTVPANPTGGSDEALSVAYGVLLGRLSAPTPRQSSPPAHPGNNSAVRHQP